MYLIFYLFHIIFKQSCIQCFCFCHMTMRCFVFVLFSKKVTLDSSISKPIIMSFVLGLFLFEHTFDNIFFNDSFESLKKYFQDNLRDLNNIFLNPYLTCPFHFFIVDVYYVHGLSPIKQSGGGKLYSNCIFCKEIISKRKSSLFFTCFST